MKISEKRIREIINEELDLAKKNHKNESIRYQLQQIAMQAALIHENLEKGGDISAWGQKKLSSISTDIDDIFYQVNHRNRSS